MVARTTAHVKYPARFQLVAAMNPCREMTAFPFWTGEVGRYFIQLNISVANLDKQLHRALKSCVQAPDTGRLDQHLPNRAERCGQKCHVASPGRVNRNRANEATTLGDPAVR